MRAAETGDKTAEQKICKMGGRKPRRQPNSCLSSFEFLSITETSQASGPTGRHTHKHGHGDGYFDQTGFTFDLI